MERSLKRLRTDYLDVLVWHDLHKEAEISNPEMAAFMEKMKKEGKARFTGFSAHGNMASLLKEAGRSGLHDVALVSYNFTHSKGLKEAVALAVRAGVGVVAMKTQAGGYKKEKMEGLNPHQAALRYVLRDPNVAAAVPGVTTLDQIEECAAVMGTTVSWGDRVRLAAYEVFLQGRTCTLCGGCSGECPLRGAPRRPAPGLDVSRQLRKRRGPGQGRGGLFRLFEGRPVRGMPFLQLCVQERARHEGENPMGTKPARSRARTGPILLILLTLVLSAFPGPVVRCGCAGSGRPSPPGAPGRLGEGQRASPVYEEDPLRARRRPGRPLPRLRIPGIGLRRLPGTWRIRPPDRVRSLRHGNGAPGLRGLFAAEDGGKARGRGVSIPPAMSGLFSSTRTDSS